MQNKSNTVIGTVLSKAEEQSFKPIDDIQILHQVQPNTKVL